MDSKQKMIALLIGVGVILGGSGGYYWMTTSQSNGDQLSYEVKTSTGTATGTISGSQESAIAYVSDVSGNVTISRAGNSSLVTKNTIIERGDMIVTDATGVAEVIFTDSSLIRLGASSSLSFASMNQANLESGSVWARILKPLGDSSAFTIKTTDLSAAVRGTAVRVSKSSSGSEAQVIDSAEGTGAVEIIAETESGSVTELLSPEESILVNEKKLKKLKLNMERILSDEETNENLKKDLIYMGALQRLEKEPSKKPNGPIQMAILGDDQFGKITREIDASLPKNNELQRFFDSSAIENEAVQLNGNTQSDASGSIMSPEDKKQLFLQLIADDMQLVGLKKQLRDERNKKLEGDNDIRKEEMQKQVNTLEESIRNFDQDWTQKNTERAQMRKDEEKRKQNEIMKLE